jgi:hypothetical protein
MIKSRRMRHGWYVDRVGDMIHAYKILVGKPEWKIALKTQWQMEMNIKMDLRETVEGCGLDLSGSGSVAGS